MRVVNAQVNQKCLPVSLPLSALITEQANTCPPVEQLACSRSTDFPGCYTGPWGPLSPCSKGIPCSSLGHPACHGAISGGFSGPITTTTSPVSPLSQLRYLRGELSDHCQPPLMSRSFSPIQSVELYPVNRPGANTEKKNQSPKPSSVPSL